MAPDMPRQTHNERIQKVLARVGLGSRREIEGWISAGRVSVDGKIAKLGDRISATARVRVDGHLLKSAQSTRMGSRVLAYHKPVGEVCSRRDAKGRPTVFAVLPNLKQGRWISIGRLDINTSGLLLFTNDGDLANRLMHPSGEIEREYAVRVFGQVNRDTLEKLTTGVLIKDSQARFTSLIDGGGKGANHWYHVVIREGRNREVRRMWECQEVKVSRLIRVRFGPCRLPRRLPPRHFHELGPSEIQHLLQAIDHKKT